MGSVKEKRPRLVAITNQDRTALRFMSVFRVHHLEDMLRSGRGSKSVRKNWQNEIEQIRILFKRLTGDSLKLEDL